MSIDADSLEEHPLLVKLLREGNPDTMTFWGYVGPSEHDGSIALYPSLENIGSAIEIPKGDILHVENVPQSVMLFGAKVVWVRRSATVVRRQADTAEDAVMSEDVREIRTGRLHMRVKTQRSDCHSPCATCKDCSSVCISSCRIKSLPE